MECVLSEPVNLGIDSWAYSKMSCSFSELELIQNGTTSAEFYLDKRVSYGDVLLLTFLMIFLAFGIVKFLSEFLIPKSVNFRRK